jgi:tetratricopeptide (TPR) repeat protein
VGTLVLGDIRREGDSLAFEAKVHDVASGDRLATEIIRAERLADPRALFDSLTARILRVSGAPAGERPGLVSQTTRSLEAYRAYIRGSAALQAFATDSADLHFSRAVELDSTFALAYIGLRNSEAWRPVGSDQEKRRQFIAKAEAHSQALPPRLKLLVQYHSAYENDQFRQARSIAEELIARDSSDVEAWYQLGEAHFHHGSARFPHPDTLGNIGKALAAFRRTRSLDPSYTLAYLHMVQVLRTCSAAGQFVCLSDSAAYGEPNALEARFGAEAMAQMRQAAADSQVSAAYQWVAATPNTVRAREMLAEILVQRGRYREAGNQAAFLRELGLESLARVLEAVALHAQAQFPEAVERIREVGESARDSLLGISPDIYLAAAGILHDGGQTRPAAEMWRNALRGWPIDTVPVYGVPIPKHLLITFGEFLALAASEVDSAHLSRAAQDWLTALGESVDDTVAYRTILSGRSNAEGGPASPYLMSYLTSRDTTILAHFLDYTERDTWSSARAQLALARGDTARARALLAGHTEPGSVTTFASPEDFIETYAWADLESRLGEPSAALETYQRLDNAVRSFGPEGTEVTGLLIRSWAERGALYQRLGDRDKAIEMYQKFIDAWREGGEDAH